MEKIGKLSWPVLFISNKLHEHDDEGIWLEEIIKILTVLQGYSV